MFSLTRPQARFKFYGTPQSYAAFFTELLSGQLYKGDDVNQLEAEACKQFGSNNTIAVAQARLGLWLAIRTLVKSGTEVVMSPYTIYDVVNMVIAAGGKPVFADIDPETCNITVESATKCIGKNTGAVLVTHLHGLACDIEAFAKLCGDNNIPLIEDAAQAVGASLNGKALGTFGDAGIYSCGRVKNLNSFFGGLLFIKEHKHAGTIRKTISEFPFEKPARLFKRIAHCMLADIILSPPVFPLVSFPIFRLGCLRDIKAVNKLIKTEGAGILRTELPENYKRRLTPFQARLLRNQLATLTNQTTARRANAKRYYDAFINTKGLQLPPWKSDNSHIYLSFPIQVSDRWALVRHMMKSGRDVMVQHIGNCAEKPCFEKWHKHCPNADKTARRVVLLQTYPGFDTREIDAQIRAVKSYCAQNSGDKE